MSELKYLGPAQVFIDPTTELDWEPGTVHTVVDPEQVERLATLGDADWEITDDGETRFAGPAFYAPPAEDPNAESADTPEASEPGGNGPVTPEAPPAEVSGQDGEKEPEDGPGEKKEPRVIGKPHDAAFGVLNPRD